MLHGNVGDGNEQYHIGKASMPRQRFQLYIHTYITLIQETISDRFDECMEQSSGDGQWSGLARTTSIIIHHLPSSIVLHQTLMFSIHYYIKASIIIHFHICSLFFLMNFHICRLHLRHNSLTLQFFNFYFHHHRPVHFLSHIYLFSLLN